MTQLESRRAFLRKSAALSSLAVCHGLVGRRALAEERSANEKLNIAFVGTANQARFSIDNLKNQNIVALCDVDDVYLAKAASDFPQAKTYADFRKMLEQPDIEAVAVCTPDHTHAPATLMALRMGKHVYCEKPLTHTVAEARLVAQEAAKAKKATQMGTQIHATDNYRRVVEIIQSGAIGRVAEVHTWVGNGWQGAHPLTDRPGESAVHWDLWLGPAACDLSIPLYSVDVALVLGFRRRRHGRHGLSSHGSALLGFGIARADERRGRGAACRCRVVPHGTGRGLSVSARGDGPPVKLTFYSGESIPTAILGQPTKVDGSLFIGDKGMLVAGYSNWKLLPEGEFAGYKPPEPTIARFDRPPCRMGQGLQGRQPDDVQFRLRRRADRSGAVGERFVSLGQ